MMFTNGTSRLVETQEVSAEAAITDAPPRPYLGGKSQWVPTSIRVKWTRDRIDGGDWSDWSPRSSIEGPRLKRSGEYSALTYVDRWVMRTDPEFGAFVESTRPADVVS